MGASTFHRYWETIMANYEYKVVSFAGQVKASRLGEVAGRLQAAINLEVGGGWEFYQLGTVNVEASPGCIASLFGARNASIQLDQLIFRRAV
jgi:hypothetical protein